MRAVYIGLELGDLVFLVSIANVWVNVAVLY